MQIYFTGFMASGKSTIGLSLAEKMNFNFIDLDNYIELKENKSINEIFLKQGESFFRKLESQYLQDIFKMNGNIIVALGGGTINSIELLKKIKNQGCLFHLKASLEMIKNRLSKERFSRPLLSNLSGKKLDLFINNKIKERNKFYLKSDLIIDSDNLSIFEILKLCESFVINYNFVSHEK